MRPDDFAAPVQAPSADTLLLSKCRDLARDHFEALPTLFKKITGLPSCVVWAPTLPYEWSKRDLPTHSRLCRELARESQGPCARCEACRVRNLTATLQPKPHGHKFRCSRGVYNFWFPINVRGCTVGIAFIQALDGIGGTRSSREQYTPFPSTAIPAAIPRVPDRCLAGAGHVSRAEFDQAAKLLTLVCAHVQALASADLSTADLAHAKQALSASENAQTRLRKVLNRLIPTYRQTSPMAESITHSERLVQQVLERVHQDYAQPIMLRQCADALRLNAAYLSDLFAHTVGVPFKAYLTAVRVEKARELLSDPAKTVSEVAYAVGYASENRFRIAFKKVTGLSPKIWRSTFRMP